MKWSDVLRSLDSRRMEWRRPSFNEEVCVSKVNDSICIRVPGGGWRTFKPDIIDSTANDWIPMDWSTLLREGKGSFDKLGEWHFRGDVIDGYVWKGRTRLSHSTNRSIYDGDKSNEIIEGY